MIKQMLLVNQGGLPLYSQKFGDFHEIESGLLGGLISAIDSMGAQLFHKKIATIFFGDEGLGSVDESLSKIVFITKDMFGSDDQYYFIFFCSGDHSTQLLREISTTVFIEIKSHLRHSPSNTHGLKEKVNRVLGIQYKNIFGGNLL